MRILFIGGTGTISMACTELAVKKGYDLCLLNRGTHPDLLPPGVKLIKANISDEEHVKTEINRFVSENGRFDAVVDFIAFTPEHIQRDINIFMNQTHQYIFISSASAYQKPPANFIITESTPLVNPYWQYSRNKIACEDLLMREHRETGFPITIVRPSHTYNELSVPVAIHGNNGSWQVIDRILHDKPILIHGDGLSLWTFTHNSDFAKAFTGLLGNPSAIGEAVHITSDECLTWNAAYQIIGRVLNKKINAVHVATQSLIKFAPEMEGALLGDKSNNAIFDNSKIKRLVPDFVATVRFDQGVAKTLEYVLSHKECQKPDPEFDALCDKIVESTERYLSV